MHATINCNAFSLLVESFITGRYYEVEFEPFCSSRNALSNGILPCRNCSVQFLVKSPINAISPHNSCCMAVTVCVWLCRFNEVLEVAEDMALDIPRIWEYLAEVLAPLVVSGCLPLAAVAALPCHGVPRQRLASLLGQTLRLARPQLSSNQELKALWTDSQLQWQDFDVEHPPDFLSQLVRPFPPPLSVSLSLSLSLSHSSVCVCVCVCVCAGTGGATGGIPSAAAEGAEGARLPAATGPTLQLQHHHQR